MSNTMSVHEMNPDPGFSFCRVTQNHERGVVFHTIEPHEGVFTFIGESALIEAVAMLQDLKPNEVVRALGDGTQAQEKKLAKAIERGDLWKQAFEELHALTAKAAEVQTPDA